MTVSTQFLLDVDNTLLDNDRFVADLRAHLTQQFGEQENQRYWVEFEQLKRECGFADYLGALQRFRRPDDANPGLQATAAWLLAYPFEERVYPDAMETVAVLSQLGPTAVLSDGDIVFQPRKVDRAGIYGAVRGAVMIFVHKEESLHSVQARFPAEHYVMVDDKPNLLAAMKRVLGERITTVFIRQGQYALNADLSKIEPVADHVIDRIGEMKALAPRLLRKTA